MKVLTQTGPCNGSPIIISEKIIDIETNQNHNKKNESVYIIIEDNGVGIKNKEKQEIELESNEGFPKKSLGTKITKERIKQFNRGFNDCKINLIIDKGENEIGTQVILIIENQ